MEEAGEQVELLVNDVIDLSDLSGPYDLILDLGCFHGLSQDEVVRYIKNLERLKTSLPFASRNQVSQALGWKKWIWKLSPHC